jgi:hypothetical protein
MLVVFYPTVTGKKLNFWKKTSPSLLFTKKTPLGKRFNPV